MLPRAALVVQDGVFAWVGEDQQVPPSVLAEGETVDAGGCVVMPGLVECHTHLVFGGQRAHEFELRARGATYEEIARQGGGIASTVRATVETAADSQFLSGMNRLDSFLSMGVTTVEVKSGYGLDTENELKILEVARSLQGRHPVDVVTTFLGAHVVAPEFRTRRADYVELVCTEMIPEVARRKLASFCDVFCDEGAFTVDESRHILQTGLTYGLQAKIHAEQLSRSGGGRLAAELGAVSADHLDHADRGDAEALAEAGVVSVFLPGATFFLGKSRYPDGRLFARAGAEVAISTDYNPGSSHTQNLWLMGTMACTHCGLEPAQALRAMTRGAARALDMDDRVGTIAPGARADFLFLDCCDWQELLYQFGWNPVGTVYKRGCPVWAREGTSGD